MASEYPLNPMQLVNLLQQTSTFVGRTTEIAEINTLLQNPDCRLLSLLGAGGMGKTRLALEVAHRQEQHFTDGVYFISLQPLIESDSIVAAIGSALQIEFDDNDAKNLTEQLSDYLSTKDMLIVLDNFEHVLHNASFVGYVLAVAPRVKILVTSREALKLRDEWIHTVQGMRYPDDIYETNVNDYGAVQLFLERSHRYKRHLDIEAELTHVIRVCQLVGGMPLGIELAVAWLNTLSVEGIANELARSVDLLTAQMRDISSRHQSIQVIFESTWVMLRANEKAAFMRLSIFRGMPTHHAIQAITGASLIALSGLVDKALLIPTDDGRYQIHELLRQYAQEKLQASDDWDAIQQTHSEYYLRLLAEYQIDIYGRRQIAALNEIDNDFENIKLAWTWAITQIRDDLISTSIEALCCYLHLRSRWKHDSHMVTEAQVAFTPKAGESPQDVWGMIAARNYMNNDNGVTVLQHALQLAESHNDKSEIGLCHFLLGSEYTYKRHFKQAIESFERSLPYFEFVEDQYHLADAHTSLALGYIALRNNKKASEHIEQALAISRTTGDINGQFFSTSVMSDIMFWMGDLEGAELYRRESILLAQQVHGVWNVIWQQWELATFYILGRMGDLQTANHLIGDTETLNRGIYTKGGWSSPAIPKSVIAGVEEQYDAAYHYWQQAHNEKQRGLLAPIHNWGLLIALSGQEDYQQLGEETYKFLDYFGALNHVPVIFIGLTFASILNAYSENNPRFATELLAFVSHNPSSLSGWLSTWPLIARLHTDLKSALGISMYQVIWEKGQQLDWKDLLPQVMAQLHDEDADGTGVIPSTSLAANSTLKEPLSERELEVLLQIARGLTNREIAEALVISVSTVKKHITHIYAKLQVDNRTQALLRAQEFNLI